MHHDRPAISQMNVTTTSAGIVLDFPQVESAIRAPDILQYQETGKGDGSLYLTHSAEMVCVKPPAKLPTEAAYVGRHPTMLSFVAFCTHRKFVLSPQTVAAQLLLEFGQYVNNNSALCAPLFNGKLGKKKELKVWLAPGESLDDLDVLAKTVGQWEKEVLRETDSRIRNAIHPELSTMNRVDHLAYSGILLGAAREFFEYTWGTLCGIPQITVQGTRQDWMKVGDLATGLGSLHEHPELSEFCNYAREVVLESIIGLYDGKEDVGFWASLVKHDSQSGAEGCTAGWLPSLNLYDENGNILPMDNRWRPGKKTYQVQRRLVPVVRVDLISDSTSGLPNIDPGLRAFFGFTGIANDEAGLRPVLGVDAYVHSDSTRR